MEAAAFLDVYGVVGGWWHFQSDLQNARAKKKKMKQQTKMPNRQVANKVWMPTTMEQVTNGRHECLFGINSSPA